MNFAELARDAITGTCDGGNCNRAAVSLAYDEKVSGLIPVCLHHIQVYRVARLSVWQAEDEFAGLRFCRRSRFRLLAQWRILSDQRAAMRGRVSRAQRRLIARAASSGAGES